LIALIGENTGLHCDPLIAFARDRAPATVGLA
jgi:hypothetical protein